MKQRKMGETPVKPQNDLLPMRIKPFLNLAVLISGIGPGMSDAFSACSTVPSGIVSWWQGQGNAADLTGGNHGTLIGSTSYAAGTNGFAFLLDGNSDLVLISNTPSLQLQDFTIEAWVKRSNASFASFGSGNIGVIFGYGNGGYSFYVNSAGTFSLSKLGDFSVANSSATLTGTNFHHVAVTKIGDTITFYIDGVADVAGSYNPTFEFSTDVAIGARPDNFDNSFLGRIDELAVFDHALSQGEIQSIYEAGSDGKCEPANPPQIISQPQNQTGGVGSIVAFQIEAVGASPLAYQWTLNGTNISGATFSTLTLTNIQLNQAGDYFAIVTNPYGSETSSIASLNVVPAPPCFNWPTGIVSWWRAEGNAFDHLGINSASLTGNANYAGGLIGQGFNFDGSGDLALIPNNPVMQLQNLTIETWIKRKSASVASSGSGGNGVLFGYGPGGYLLYLNSAGQVFFSKLGSTAVASSWSISDTNLHHVALTKSNTVVNFYLDGTNVSSASYSTTFTFTTQVGIGGRPDNSDNSFNGIIDELALYNRALTPSDIQSIQAASYSGKCAVYLSPTFASQPTNRTVAPGTNITFTASIGGTPPFVYQWRLNGVVINGATNSALTLNNVQPPNAGLYSLSVTNSGGSAASSNATLKINVITATGNGQPLTNTSHSFAGNVTVQLQSAYTNGLIFYTLNGSVPSFTSSQYTSPFVVGQNATLRAVGYSSDFFNSGESDPIQISIVPSYSLTTSNAGGGSVVFNPVGGNYLSNANVIITATPSSGWVFMHWLGDTSGTNPVTTVNMSRGKIVRPVFGTTFTTSAAGGGSVLSSPSTTGVYPYGTAIRLSAVPQAGNYFALWGNAASGNTNPLSFTLTNSNPTVSSLFAAVGGGQSALTVVPLGLGQISVNPRANVYSTGSSVTLTAIPVAGQTFTGWSGDSSGTQNPLNLSMNQNKLIYANFTRRPTLRGELFREEGLRLTATGDFMVGYQFEASTNLLSWSVIGIVTNTSGTVQFTDAAATNIPARLYRAVLLQ